MSAGEGEDRARSGLRWWNRDHPVIVLWCAAPWVFLLYRGVWQILDFRFAQGLYALALAAGVVGIQWGSRRWAARIEEKTAQVRARRLARE